MTPEASKDFLQTDRQKSVRVPDKDQKTSRRIQQQPKIQIASPLPYEFNAIKKQPNLKLFRTENKASHYS